MFDTLGALVTGEVVEEIMDRGMLEVLPLTHIRGRSLHDAFVIVDEAQSLERNVLLTVLSRIGAGSRVVLTHDVAQRDNLRVGRHDGVAAVIEALKGHPLFAHVTLSPLRAVADRGAGHRAAGGPAGLRPGGLSALFTAFPRSRSRSVTGISAFRRLHQFGVTEPTCPNWPSARDFLHSRQVRPRVSRSRRRHSQ